MSLFQRFGQWLAGPTPLPAEGIHQDAYPQKCPITGRPYFMTLEHPELGMVPTYGGPFDSYTIPQAEGEATQPWHERELRSERYDHDAGWWVEGGEPIPLRIVHDDVLEAPAMATMGLVFAVAYGDNREVRAMFDTPKQAHAFVEWLKQFTEPASSAAPTSGVSGPAGETFRGKTPMVSPEPGANIKDKLP